MIMYHYVISSKDNVSLLQFSQFLDNDKLSDQLVVDDESDDFGFLELLHFFVEATNRGQSGRSLVFLIGLAQVSTVNLCTMSDSSMPCSQVKTFASLTWNRARCIIRSPWSILSTRTVFYMLLRQTSFHRLQPGGVDFS